MNTDISREEKFKILAQKRVTNTIKSLRNIGKLSERRNYKYSDEDVKKIFKALKEELSKCEALFNNHKNDEINFKL